MQVEVALPIIISYPLHSRDARGVLDRAVEPRFHAFEQEGAVERVTEYGLQPEAHVGGTENCRDTRQLSLDSPDGLDGLDSVLPEILLAGAEGKGEAVEDQIRGVDPILPGGEVVDPATHTNLPFRGARLPFLVASSPEHAPPAVPRVGAARM